MIQASENLFGKTTENLSRNPLPRENTGVGTSPEVTEPQGQSYPIMNGSENERCILMMSYKNGPSRRWTALSGARI